MKIDIPTLVAHGYKTSIDPIFLERFLSLDSTYQDMVVGSARGPGWGLVLTVAERNWLKISPLAKNLPEMLKKLEWKFFSSRKEMESSLDKTDSVMWWIPWDLDDLIRGVGIFLLYFMEEKPLDYQWSRSDGLFKISLRSSSEHAYIGLGSCRELAVLNLVYDIIDYRRRLRKPSFSQLGAECEIVREGHNGEPTLIAPRYVLHNFMDLHGAYLLAKNPSERSYVFASDTDFYGRETLLGQIDLMEGIFWLLSRD